MCGIFGFSGTRDCVPDILTALGTLEYRGYDSAGIAVETGCGIETVKSCGRLSVLRERLSVLPALSGNCGIGHTRWATHGVPSDANAHPHSAPSLTLVHNGIIENYAELKEILVGDGCSFKSDTDTEIAALWIAKRYRELCEPVRALFAAAADLRGSFAFAVLFRDHPGKIYAMRRDSPLILANTETESLISSDLTALISYTKAYTRLPENTVAVLAGADVRIYLPDGKESSVPQEFADWDVRAAEKDGYAFFMEKEIHEDADAILRTVRPYLLDGIPFFGVPAVDGDSLRGINRIRIVACGTAMHAGLLTRYWIEKYARVSADVEVASEFRSRDPILEKGDLVILISQSGETADTLAALRLARSRGARTLAIVNVVGSSVAREADDVIYTRAGPEIAVASTKAFTAQCAVLYLLSLRLALLCGTMKEDAVRSCCAALTDKVPQYIAEVLAETASFRRLAQRLKEHEHVFFIGRGADSLLCCEGALKLKEISYIHCEAYPAGELKHGTLSLVTDGTPVIALITEEALADKMISNVREVASRGAYVICFVTRAIVDYREIPADFVFPLPGKGDEALFPMITALQLLACEVSSAKGLDVDCPRNLAKSVTVE